MTPEWHWPPKLPLWSTRDVERMQAATADLRLYHVRQGDDEYFVRAADHGVVWLVAGERWTMRRDAARRGDPVPRCTWPPVILEVLGGERSP